jgi:hypothetical protein
MVNKYKVIVIFLNILSAIVVCFMTIIILGFINYLNFHNIEIIKTKFIKDIFSQMIVMFTLCIFPQLIYKLLLLILNKIFHLNLNIILYNLFSIIASIISIKHWSSLINESINARDPELIINFNDYLNGLYFTIIIGGILFINISYLLKKIIIKNNNTQVYGT